MNDIDAFGDDWVLSGKAQSTFQTYRQILNKAPFQLPGNLREAKRWLSERRTEIAPATIVVYVRALRAFSAWWAEEYRKEDPLKDLEFPKVPVAAPGAIVDDDVIETLRDSLTVGGSNMGPTMQRDLAILEMFVHTGMRRSELVALDVDDVDFQAARITIKPSKNGEGRIIPIHSALRVPLRRYIRLEREYHRHTEEPALFLGRDGRLRADSITRMFKRVSERAGLDHVVGTHEFRRRFADQWISGGGADDHLMVIAGWKSAAMPARYRAANSKDRALAQYDKILDPGKATPGDKSPVSRPRSAKPTPRRIVRRGAPLPVSNG